ncbi:hypothetical protein PAXRUDRAFT_831214 [Paxillus rubicundulus Ve08.2h10]|uniref:Uncharacterized protein n=1 Tax=Paxillus rubicundulus Ve08.2h10 TaxID=930991 RepID=A0A0D0D3G0_9AGAM|nr:hypothetical protein PAXRUDRAFT_831214 [Paxillus rubicundulus Ve08.2h10]
MAESDIVLRFVTSTDSNADMRTFRVFQVIQNAAEQLELYRVRLLLSAPRSNLEHFHSSCIP